MLSIVKSVLHSTDENKASIINDILTELAKDLNPQEQAVFEYLKSGFDTHAQFQTEELFLQKFPEYKSSLKESDVLDDKSLDYHKREFIEDHRRIAISRKLLMMANSVRSTGLTPDMVESLRNSTTKTEEDSDVLKKANILELYEDSKKRSSRGIKTYIPEIDQLIGNIEPGTISVIAGYSGHGKTSWALNMAYKGARDGIHVVYISLEIAERNLLYDMVSLHSSDPKFGKPAIPHTLIRQGKLDKEQEAHLKVVVEDFNKTILPNLCILTERNFKDFSFGEVRDILYKIDTEKPIDTIFVDHANLLKYYIQSRYSNTGDAINDFVSFFRKLAICFKKENGQDRQISVILLAQCNRAGWESARNMGRKDPNLEGFYNNNALSESNELERAASYVFFAYSSEDMRLNKEARVSFTKSRFGASHENPICVSFDPEFYIFGEMSDTNTNSASDYSSASSFDSFMGIDPMSLGFGFGNIDMTGL